MELMNRVGCVFYFGDFCIGGFFFTCFRYFFSLLFFEDKVFRLGIFFSRLDFLVWFCRVRSWNYYVFVFFYLVFIEVFFLCMVLCWGCRDDKFLFFVWWGRESRRLRIIM